VRRPGDPCRDIETAAAVQDTPAVHDVTPCHQTPWIPTALSPPPKDLPYNPSRPCRGNTGHDGDCVGRGRRLRRRASVARRPGRFRPRVPPRALRPGCAGRCASGAGAKMPGPGSGTDGNINRRTGGREIALTHSRAIPRPPVFPPHSMARPATGRGGGEARLSFSPCGVRSGGRRPGKANDLAFPTTNARSHSGGPGGRAKRGRMRGVGRNGTLQRALPMASTQHPCTPSTTPHPPPSATPSPARGRERASNPNPRSPT